MKIKRLGKLRTVPFNWKPKSKQHNKSEATPQSVF